MLSRIETIRNPRKQILNVIQDLSMDQLNKVPQGLNNNIVWNIAHLIASQQSLCYKYSHLELIIDDSFYLSYKFGTKPEVFVNNIEFERIKLLLFSTIDQFSDDYTSGVFTSYEAFTTRYGITINNIDDAINFLPFHEGFHFSCIMTLKKMVAL